MIKASLIIMTILTIAFSFGLRWREGRMAAMPAARARKSEGWIAAQKRKANRWVTAAMFAAITTLLVLGGLHWLRVWQQ